MNIDFTTTACNRPDILDRTYASFARNLRGINLREQTLYLTVDPLPTDKDRTECGKVATKYFHKVALNTPQVPNYTEAYNWVWSNAQSEYIFNLEDDWELTTEININDMLNLFTDDTYEVALRAYPYRYRTTCTSPALLHEKWYKAIAGKLDPSRNPETQTHEDGKFGIFIPNKQNCEKPEKYITVYPNRVVLKDIGRDWMDSSGYIRPQMLDKSHPDFIKKDGFTKWVKK